MPTDDFTVSVTNSVTTDLAIGRPWQVGAYVTRAGVYAPAAATNFEFGLLMDGFEVFPRGTQPVGTTPSASPALEHKAVDYTAQGQIRMPCFHSGASAQTIRVQLEYEAVISTSNALVG